MIHSVPAPLLSFLERYDFFVIASHKEPDGDSVASSLALSSFLNRRGKRSALISSGPFKRPEIKEFEPLFATSIEGISVPEGAALLVVDCSGIDRVGDAAVGLENLPRAIIDHHATNDSKGEADYVLPSAPATTILIQDIIESLAGTPLREEAELLLFGLCTDRAFSATSTSAARTPFLTPPASFPAANPKRTFARMNGGKSFESRMLISRILSRMTRYYGGKLIISHETIEDTKEYGLEGRDSDSSTNSFSRFAGLRP
jgi:phosphoesterase RecJ-like protein